MKGIKIKIIKEQIEFDSYIYKEVELKDPGAFSQNVGLYTTEDISVGEKTYKARKVYRGFDNTPIIYFVEEDDNLIFNDLIQVSNDDIKRQYNNGVDFGQLYMLEKFKSFLYKPWYKRIFVKKYLNDIKNEIYRIKNTF